MAEPVSAALLLGGTVLAGGFTLTAAVVGSSIPLAAKGVEKVYKHCEKRKQKKEQKKAQAHNLVDAPISQMPVQWQQQQHAISQHQMPPQYGIFQYTSTPSPHPQFQKQPSHPQMVLMAPQQGVFWSQQPIPMQQSMIQAAPLRPQLPQVPQQSPSLQTVSSASQQGFAQGQPLMLTQYAFN